MIAQLYTDHDPIVRLFARGVAVADLPLPRSLFGKPRVGIEAAKIALARIGFQAKSKWEKTEWGWEARVSRQGKS